VSQVTDLLVRWRTGDQGALDALMPLVYAELRNLARGLLRRERDGHTLQPTALVHEAYLRLVRESSGYNNRIHFLGAAATAMRRVLVDHARRRRAVKRGRGERTLDLDRSLDYGIDPGVDLLALDQALGRLAERWPTPAKVIELRYFGGLSVAESAELLGVAPITVKRHWAFARVWLYRELSAGGG
jgi:RNA polymerase sigma-70 factor, ECF subfamily